MASKKFTQFDTANNTPETELSVGVKGTDNFKRRNYLTATANPTVNDDNSDGYTVGSMWLNTSTGTLYVCKDSTVGAAVWASQGGGGGGGVTDLQGAYDGGNVVNGSTVTIDGTSNVFAVGISALEENTGDNVNALGTSSAAFNSGNDVNAFGREAGANSPGNNVNALGNQAALVSSGNDVNAMGILACAESGGSHINALGNRALYQNSASNVNAFGQNAGRLNFASDSNFFGRNAGYNSPNGNETPFGVTVFSPESVPAYANRAAALASITTANGAVTGQVYIYRNEETNAIEFIVP